MNKIFKGAVLSLFALAGLASCSDDEFNYVDAAAPTGAQVYFSNETPTDYTITEEATSFSIPVLRANTAGAVDVPLTVTGTEGTIYTVPSSISFSDGAETANIVVSYDASKMEYGRYDTLSIAIDPAMTTPYGVSTIKIIAGATAWVDYGVAQYREDLMTTFYGVDNLVYNVPIQKNIVKEGYYRLVNPYGAYYPYNEDGDYDPDAVCYMTINATDPDWVYVEDCETAMDWGYGAFAMYGYAYYYLIKGNELDVVKAAKPELFGTLKDGIITMPAGSFLISMADYNDGGLYPANNNGLFGVALPGAAFSDYSIEVSYAGMFTDASNNVYAVGNLSLGADATNVKAVVMSADDDAAAVADAIAAGDLEATTVNAGRIEVPVAADLTGKLQLIAVVIDGGEAKALATAEFEYYGGGAIPWESLGIGYYVDDIVVPMYTENVGPYGYEVEIQESTETPGLYRLVNLYAPVAAAFGETGGNKSIEVHAEDPDGVYVLEQSIGLDFGYGEMFIVSEGGRYVAANGFDVVKQARPDLLGTLKDGVITFPSFAALDANGEETGITYQFVFFEDDGGYYAGTNGAVEIYLPEAYQNSARLKGKAEMMRKAAQFERNLKAGKKVAAKRAFSKKIVKKNAKKAEARL